MHILGVSCYFHAAAAALLRDGDLIAAAEEERFSRIKHDSICHCRTCGDELYSNHGRTRIRRIP